MVRIHGDDGGILLCNLPVCRLAALPQKSEFPIYSPRLMSFLFNGDSNGPSTSFSERSIVFLSLALSFCLSPHPNKSVRLLPIHLL
ncbi:hypothetical protein SLA2020_243270 [Shorea laevis]